MKRLAVVALCLALVGCGGDDDIQPIRDAFNSPGVVGGNNSGNSSDPSTPVPDSDSLWEYDQVGSSRFAEIRSTNTVPTTNEFNDAIMTIQLQNAFREDGDIITYLNIRVFFADTACDVSCNIRIKKNGRPGSVYTAKERSEGVFDNDSFSASDLRSIIKDIKVSNNASLTLPLTSVPDAEFFFDFSGYDTKFMGN